MPETYTATIGGDGPDLDDSRLAVALRVADSIGYTVVPAGTVELLLDVVRAYEARVEESDVFLRIAQDEATRLRSGLREIETVADRASRNRDARSSLVDDIAAHARELLDGTP